MSTIPAVDRALLETRERLLAADEANDEAAVSAIWLRLDELLDERLHLPQQRPSTEGP